MLNLWIKEILAAKSIYVSPKEVKLEDGSGKCHQVSNEVVKLEDGGKCHQVAAAEVKLEDGWWKAQSTVQS